MYFIAKGEMVVSVKDAFRKEHIVGKLKAGDHCGEIALYYDCSRTATVTCFNYTTVAKLSVQKFKKLS